VNGHILQFVAHLGVFVVLVVIARFILNHWASIDSDNDSTVLEGEGNMAVAIRHGAFYIAFGIALFATMDLSGGASSFGGILLESLAWGAGILVALLLSLFINDKLVLPYVDNSRAIGRDGNAPGFRLHHVRNNARNRFDLIHHRILFDRPGCDGRSHAAVRQNFAH
jgi:uncharacterized membrane protein YjfL (UPF0719 family)